MYCDEFIKRSTTIKDLFGKWREIQVSHTQLITPYLTVINKATVGPYTTEEPGKGLN